MVTKKDIAKEWLRGLWTCLSSVWWAYSTLFGYVWTSIRHPRRTWATTEAILHVVAKMEQWKKVSEQQKEQVAWKASPGSSRSN